MPTNSSAPTLITPATAILTSTPVLVYLCIFIAAVAAAIAAAGLLAHAASTRCGATHVAIAPLPSAPPTAAHTSATTLSCLARRHCTPLPPRAPLNRFARSSSSRWRSVHAGFARLTVSTPSYSPSPRPLGLPPRLSRRTPRAPLAPCATHRASPIAKFHLLSGAPLAGRLPVVM